MENAGFYVIMSEVSVLENEIFLKEQQWNTHLETAKQQVSDYILFLGTRNRGVLAEKIQDYYREVHQYLLNGLGCVMSELSMRVLQYAEGLYEIEEDYKGRIRQEELQAHEEELARQRSLLCSLVEEADKVIGKIPDFCAKMPSTEELEGCYETMNTRLATLEEEVEAYESAHLPDMDNVEEMLSCLRKFIEFYKGKPEAGLQNYASSSLLKSPEGKRLMEAQEAYQGYVERNMDKLDRLREQRTERLIRQREEQGMEQLETGVQHVVGGLGAAAFAILLGPETVVAGAIAKITAVAGGVEFVFGTAESIEGTDNIRLARQGDIETEAYNPLKAAIPYLKEHPEVYYGIMNGSAVVSNIGLTVIGCNQVYRMQGLGGAAAYAVSAGGSEIGSYVTQTYMVQELGMEPEAVADMWKVWGITLGFTTVLTSGRVQDICDTANAEIGYYNSLPVVYRYDGPYGVVSKVKTSYGKSSENLDWNAVVSRRGETRKEHVALHEVNDLSKPSHGVFYGDSTSTINKAWNNRGNRYMISEGNTDLYIIPYQNAGYAGGYGGQGNNLNYVTIITQKGTNNIITGFPGNGYKYTEAGLIGGK